MENDELIKRLRKVERILDNMPNLPQISKASYEIWHIIRELQMEENNEISENKN